MVAPTAARAIPTTTTYPLVLEGEVKQQVDSLESQAATVGAEIETLDADVERLTEGYNQLKLVLDGINAELASLRRELARAEERHQRQQAIVDARLRATYKNGNSGLVEIILATNSFSDFVNRLLMIAKVTINDQQIADEYEASAQDVARLEGLERQKKAEELEVRRLLDDQTKAVEAKLEERTAYLAGLNEDLSRILEQERTRQETERKRLEAELKQRLAGWQLYYGELPQTDDAVLNQVIETAAFYLGIPYVWSGSRPATGFDCSGFTSYVLRQHGVNLPHYSVYQSQMGVPVPRELAQAGDVVAFGFPVHHVGLCIGDDKFIHAPRTGDVVKIQALSTRSDINTIRRFPLHARQGMPSLD
jgi:cell wall-associated NlpC family hydrolase